MRLVATLFLALTSLAGSGCYSTPMVSLSSDPPGAKVLIDERDTGFVTPCELTIANSDHRIDFVLPGYDPMTRWTTNGRLAQAVIWNDMFISFQTFRFPLWLNYRDFLIPVEQITGPLPNRIFVRMQRSSRP